MGLVVVSSGAPPKRSTEVTPAEAEGEEVAIPLVMGEEDSRSERSSESSRRGDALAARETTELRMRLLERLLELVVRLRRKSGFDGAMDTGDGARAQNWEGPSQIRWVGYTISGIPISATMLVVDSVDQGDSSELICVRQRGGRAFVEPEPQCS